MAILKGPFLSISARGQIAKTLVAFNWKGLNCVRQHVVPSNPNTAAQQTQRTLFSDCVAVWRNTFTNELMRTAWNVAALVSGVAQSGFNVAMSAMTQTCSTNADASFALSVAAIADYKAEIVLKNADDGATGDEAGDFQVWKGTAPASLLLMGTKTIAAGKITTDALNAAAADVYVQIRKDGFARSGITKITTKLA